jgi:ketosteroid isomerase-like protein
MPSTSGKDGIRTLLTQMIADPALALHFEASSVDVAKSGDLGYTRGKYTMDMTDPQTKQVVHDHGSYVTTYRKQADGTWKAVTDIASSETPSIPIPPPAPAKAKPSATKAKPAPAKGKSSKKSKHK